MARAVGLAQSWGAVGLNGRSVLAIVPGTSVLVCNQGTSTPISETIYADPTSGTTLSNPLTTDSTGTKQFYLEDPKVVTLIKTAAGYTFSNEDLLVGEPAQSVDLGGTYQALTGRNAASGYMGLDSNGLPDAARFGANTHLRTFESFGGAVGANAATQATAWTAARVWGLANPGAELKFGAGTYANMPQLNIPQYMVLRGTYFGGCEIKAKDSLNADFLVAHVSTGASDPNGKYLAIQGLKINGNKANQTSGRGIVLIPGSYVSGHDPTADSQNLVRDCWVYSCKSDGITSNGDSATLIDHCRVDVNDGNGITTGFDTQIVNCNIGGSGLAGVNWGGTAGPGSVTGGDINVVATGTWSYLSGQVTASAGSGWIVNGNRNNGAHLSSCGAQDNKAYGFQSSGNSFLTMASCSSDSNSTSSAGTYAGIDLWDTQDSIIQCVCQDRNGGNTQTYAIQVRSASTGNTIDIRHRGVAGSTVNAPIQSWSADSVGNSVCINNSGFAGVGQQNLAYAATITPNPTLGGTIVLGALTGNLTVNAIAAGNQWPGQRIRFHITQDATGGRTITWNAAYHLSGSGALPTTLSKRCVIEFEYDATAAYYVEVFRSTGI